MTKKLSVLVVVGVFFLIVFNAASAQAATPSSCGGANQVAFYAGPCETSFPAKLLFYVKDPNITKVYWQNLNSDQYYHGYGEVDQISGPDSDGWYQVSVLIRYAIGPTIDVVLSTTSSRPNATIQVLGNTLTEPFSNIKPLPITAVRSGGGCRITTSLSFYAIQDFSYQVGLKLKGGYQKKPILRMTSKDQRTGEAEFPHDNGSFQQWTFIQTLSLTRKQVKALAHGKYKLRAFQSVSLYKSKQAVYLQARTVRLKKSNCSGAMASSL